MLTNHAMALAHLKADDYTHMRLMRIKLPKAWGRNPKPVMDVDPRIVAVLLLHEFNELQRTARKFRYSKKVQPTTDSLNGMMKIVSHGLPHH